MSSVAEGAPTAEIKIETVNDLLTVMAVNMRRFDEAQDRIRELKKLAADRASKLDDIDIDVPLKMQPMDLAMVALQIHLLELTASRLEIEAQAINGELSVETYSQFEGRRYTITPIGRRSLGRFVNDLEEPYAMGGSRNPQTGTLLDLNTDLSSGGKAKLSRRGGNFWSAYPLIDRGADYAPNFAFEEAA